jgi:hypothetical protein
VGVLFLARGDFRQPDRRFDRFELAEEWTNGLEVVVPPVLQEALGHRGHAPVGRVVQPPPVRNVRPDLVDVGEGVGLPFLVLEAEQILLFRLLGLLLYRRNRRNQLRLPSSIYGRQVKRLTFGIQRMMAARLFVG